MLKAIMSELMSRPKTPRSRVVVTGLGAVTPMAVGVEASWRALCRGESGIKLVRRFGTSGMRTRIGGENQDFVAADFVDSKMEKHFDRFVLLAVAASKMAAEDAGLEVRQPDSRRIGVVIGNCLGGASLVEQGLEQVFHGNGKRMSPFFIPGIIGSSAAGVVAIVLRARGPNLAVNSACASGADAVGYGLKMLRNGEVDVVIAGGTEAPITPLLYHGFTALGATSARNDEPERASRPFDRERDGFVPAEGAGMLVLEELDFAMSTGAKIYAEAVGFGSSCDAYHITSPDPRAEGAAAAMTNALRDAGIATEEVDYVNAHGTSTRLNDRVESKAIRKVFDGRVAHLPVSSCKSVTGHTIAAAGALEAIFSILAIRDGIVPPTVNYESSDPECDLDYVPNIPRKQDIRTVLSNSFGFGGANTSLVLRRWNGRSVRPTARAALRRQAGVKETSRLANPPAVELAPIASMTVTATGAGGREEPSGASST
jgi:3-oxoacyl-[acyl-carrier-protein] synthase II